MTKLEELDMQVLQDHLGLLSPKSFKSIPVADEAWILSDFLLSWGQRLPLNEADWPPEAQRENLRRFGLTVWPFSTSADFPVVRADQLSILSLALTSLNLFVMLLDPIIDEPLTVPTAVKLAIQPVLMHFHRTSSLLFSSSSSFWNEVEQHMNCMSKTMLEEHQRSCGPVQPFSWDEFKHIAHGKMAFARINCIALAILNGTPELIPVLTECWDAISLASIINDDTLDWREDYINANYTYLLSQVLFSPPFNKQVQAGHPPDLAEIGAALFCTDVIESLNRRAYDELTSAAHRAVEIECLALAQLIRRIQTKISSRFTKLFDRKIMALVAAVGDNT